jgi:hypothetical protein
MDIYLRDTATKEAHSPQQRMIRGLHFPRRPFSTLVLACEAKPANHAPNFPARARAHVPRAGRGGRARGQLRVARGRGPLVCRSKTSTPPRPGTRARPSSWSPTKRIPHLCKAPSESAAAHLHWKGGRAEKFESSFQPSHPRTPKRGTSTDTTHSTYASTVTSSLSSRRASGSSSGKRSRNRLA